MLRIGRKGEIRFHRIKTSSRSSVWVRRVPNQGTKSIRVMKWGQDQILNYVSLHVSFGVTKKRKITTLEGTCPLEAGL